MDVSYMRSYQDATRYEPVRVERFVWRFVLGTMLAIALVAWFAWPYVSRYLALPDYLVYFVLLGIAANAKTTRRFVCCLARFVVVWGRYKTHF